jgi:hypothetical protein
MAKREADWSTADEFIYKAQDVNYLGFLEAQLRDLQGVDTLAYELIQNADDARDKDGRFPATTISFDITDEALVVTNDGPFRPLDFARLQSIAGGDKRAEADTTGAFGLGFIAVYQVTDAPEIFAADRHWIIRPEAPPAQRIRERRLETTGTRFRLPWAFAADSAVRRTLRLAAIRPEQLDEFAGQITEAIKTAVFFLRHLQTLEVRRNGDLLVRVGRQVEADSDGQTRLTRHVYHAQTDLEETAVWLLLNGDFAAEATALRAAHEWQIEAHRRSQVYLALPLDRSVGPGRLFAVLPTGSGTPLPFHINADFFPTTDRKRIHFDSGYQAAWNEAAIRCAAQLLAANLAILPDRLGAVNFWQLLQQMAEAERQATIGELPAVFAAFWQAVIPLLPQTPIFYTAQEEWRLPAAGRIPAGQPFEATAVSLLTALHIPLNHPDLAPYLTLMRRPAVGVAPLTVPDVAEALAKIGLTTTRLLFAAPPFLDRLDAWLVLWRLLDRLLLQLERPVDKTAALDALNRCAIVLTDRMELSRPNFVYRGGAEAQALFPDAAWLHPAVPADAFPGRLVAAFGVRQAVDLLAEMPIDQLEEAWRLGRLDLPRLWRWFEAQQIEILADDPALRPAIRRLPLCPTAGELRPLAHLYLPGDFNDPLKLAGLVDLAAMGGRPQFLRDLGVPELTFESYVHRELPRVLAQHADLAADDRQRLLQLLAARLGEIRDDEALQAQLSQLPLIPCMDGIFRAGQQVYAARDVVALLGDGAYVAEPAESQAVQALYTWLGVRTEPAPAAIAESLLALARTAATKAPDAATLARVAQCWMKLNELDSPLTEETAVLLRVQPVMPNRHHSLTRPDHLFWPDQAELALKFADPDAFLLPEALWGRAVAAAGVRPLSVALQLQLIYPANAVADPALAQRLKQRRPLIERLLSTAARGQEAAGATAFLDSLRVWRTPRLQVQYRLPLAAAEAVTTTPETAAVKLDAHTNSLVVTAGEPGQLWPAVARELALALSGDGLLALGLRELLAAESYSAAAQALTELGL